MCNFRTCATLTAISASVVLCAPAQAGSGVSAWVSGTGQDVSGCGPAETPCRTFQYAHDNTLGANGGDILVKDSGNYGPLNITKPVSVVNDGSGTAGSGAPPGGTAIAINTTGKVLLKGLIVDGVGGANYGVNVIQSAKLTIVNCTVQNFNSTGVLITPDNVFHQASDTNFSIQGSLVQNNFRGVYVDGSMVLPSHLVRGAISNSRILGNSAAGVSTTVTGDTPGQIQLEIADTLVSYNLVGINAAGVANTAVALRHSIITRNISLGYQINSPAAIQTYGDNVISGNGGNTGTLTPVTTN